MKKYSTRSMNRGTCAVFPDITRKMNNVCIFSHDEVTHDIAAVHFSSNYS